MTDLNVDAASVDRVVLTWQPTSNNTQGYRLSIHQWQKLGHHGHPRRRDHQLHGYIGRGEPIYEYRVRAFDAWGMSPSSPVLHVRTPKAFVTRKIGKKNKLPARPQEAALARDAFSGPSVRGHGSKSHFFIRPRSIEFS